MTSKTVSKYGFKTETWWDGKYPPHQQKVSMWSILKYQVFCLCSTYRLTCSFLCGMFPSWGISNISNSFYHILYLFRAIYCCPSKNIMKFMKTKMVSPLLDSYRVWKAGWKLYRAVIHAGSGQKQGRNSRKPGIVLPNCNGQAEQLKETYLRQIFSAVQEGKQLY